MSLTKRDSMASGLIFTTLGMGSILLGFSSTNAAFKMANEVDHGANEAGFNSIDMLGAELAGVVCMVLGGLALVRGYNGLVRP